MVEKYAVSWTATVSDFSKLSKHSSSPLRPRLHYRKARACQTGWKSDQDLELLPRVKNVRAILCPGRDHKHHQGVHHTTRKTQ